MWSARRNRFSARIIQSKCLLEQVPSKYPPMSTNKKKFMNLLAHLISADGEEKRSVWEKEGKEEKRKRQLTSCRNWCTGIDLKRTKLLIRCLNIVLRNNAGKLLLMSWNYEKGHSVLSERKSSWWWVVCSECASYPGLRLAEINPTVHSLFLQLSRYTNDEVIVVNMSN